MRQQDGFRMCAVLLMTALIWTTGCESEDTETSNTPTQFTLNRELVSYSSSDYFLWDTTLDQVVATIKIEDFSHGSATLKIFDALGKQVMSRYLLTPNNTTYVGTDDLYNTVLSNEGTPGQWRIQVNYSEFTGDVDLSLDPVSLTTSE